MEVFGMVTERLPANQKVTINCPLLGLSVIALMENETEATLENMYSPAFGVNTAQDIIKKVTGVAQSNDASEFMASADTERALVSTLNTQQVYEGSEPPAVDLALLLVAMEDPKREVEDAISALKEMSLPSLTLAAVNSRPPPPVTINVKRQILLTNGRIESYSLNDFGTFSPKGTLWSKISLRIKAMQMPSRRRATSEGPRE
jgi:hypothetical protein